MAGWRGRIERRGASFDARRQRPADGTFIDAERRIGMMREIMQPRSGHAGWETALLIMEAAA
ncbi:MAG TPA: hypothetical protein VHW66_17195 [Stellaceae bacterium]|jgi:predicted molibdopterin-dependent oxidoreductase YjgC|nr:hypothetical protein [Stellaceae bacterium]